MAEGSATRKALTPAEARDIILNAAQRARAVGNVADANRYVETIPIEAALGRCLAQPLMARRTQPPFTTTAMDGYAVRASDIDARPAALSVVGEAAAGHPFVGTVGPREAVRIFTGAPLPMGADAIVIQENTRRDGQTVTVLEGKPDPEHVRPVGGDFTTGARLLAQGHCLTPRTLALAAAMGHGEVTVAKRPHVAILATGDELQLPGNPLGPGQIVASNHLAIAGLIEQAGGQPEFLGIARDNRPDLDAKLESGLRADVLVTIGGASVGDHDLVAPALKAHGIPLDFWKIAMRPGKPLMFATAQRSNRVVHIVGLPGNPVSSYVCTLLFVVPLVRNLLGQPDTVVPTVELPVTTRLSANGNRAHYMRARRMIGSDGKMHVRPMDNQDSSLLSVLAEADSLIVRDIGAGAVEAGDVVPVLPIDL